jgi:hypothetical protein
MTQFSAEFVLSANSPGLEKPHVPGVKVTLEIADISIGLASICLLYMAAFF